LSRKDSHENRSFAGFEIQVNPQYIAEKRTEKPCNKDGRHAMHCWNKIINCAESYFQGSFTFFSKAG
jgi:hypothetical protein